MGQSKPINSVDFRAERPFRIVTASEDNTLAFFHGPPFKFQFTMQVSPLLFVMVMEVIVNMLWESSSLELYVKS